MDMQGSFCVCAQPMRYDVTMQHRLSLARSIQKMIPVYATFTTNKNWRLSQDKDAVLPVLEFSIIKIRSFYLYNENPHIWYYDLPIEAWPRHLWLLTSCANCWAPMRYSFRSLLSLSNSRTTAAYFCWKYILRDLFCDRCNDQWKSRIRQASVLQSTR